MTKKQKGELFQAIKRTGYKETQERLMDFLSGVNIELDDDFMTILGWFNYWYNKGEFENDVQSVVRFIQINTFTNPLESTTLNLDSEFKRKWKSRFHNEIKE